MVRTLRWPIRLAEAEAMPPPLKRSVASMTSSASDSDSGW